jgi:hypothetical protein
MVSTPKSAKKSVSTPKSVKKSASTPKVATPRSKKKQEIEIEIETETESEKLKTPVKFASDDGSDLIHDIERLAHYKPELPDIPEEDYEAHAVNLFLLLSSKLKSELEIQSIGL